MDFYETINLHGVGAKTQEEFIDFSKFMSTIQKSRLKEKDKNKRCFICKKKNKDVCNSHTIPRFVLKNIAKDGKLNNTQIFNSAKLIKNESGINNTHTFHSICKNCDNTIFKEYETPENLENEPTQKIMKQIALKNHISRFNKHNEEKKLYNHILKDFKNFQSGEVVAHFVKQILPVTEHNYCYNRKRANAILKALSTDTKLYKLCYYKKLNHVVPFSIQANSILSLGFNDELLANTFEFTDFDNVDDIHFCIYPLKSQTVIFIFCSVDMNIYDNFFNILKEKNTAEQLSILNFISFAYFEDIYLHQQLDSSILNNSHLQKLTQEQMMAISNQSNVKHLSVKEREKLKLGSLNKNFSIINHTKIPNLLDEQYKVNTSL